MFSQNSNSMLEYISSKLRFYISVRDSGESRLKSKFKTNFLYSFWPRVAKQSWSYKWQFFFLVCDFWGSSEARARPPLYVISCPTSGYWLSNEVCWRKNFSVFSGEIWISRHLHAGAWSFRDFWVKLEFPASSIWKLEIFGIFGWNCAWIFQCKKSRSRFSKFRVKSTFSAQVKLLILARKIQTLFKME